MFVDAAGGRNKRGVVLGTGALARELVPSTRGRTGARPPGEDLVPVLRQQLQQTQEEVQQLRQQAARFETLLREQQELVQQLLARQQPPSPEPDPLARQVCIKPKLFFI